MDFLLNLRMLPKYFYSCLSILLKTFFSFLAVKNKNIQPQIHNENYSCQQDSPHFPIHDKMGFSDTQTEYDSGVSLTSSRTSTPDQLEPKDDALLLELREENVRLQAQIEILLRIILNKESVSSRESEFASGVSKSTQTPESDNKLLTKTTQFIKEKTSSFIEKKSR